MLSVQLRWPIAPHDSYPMDFTCAKQTLSAGLEDSWLTASLSTSTRRGQAEFQGEATATVSLVYGECLCLLLALFGGCVPIA